MTRLLVSPASIRRFVLPTLVFPTPPRHIRRRQQTAYGTDSGDIKFRQIYGVVSRRGNSGDCRFPTEGRKPFFAGGQRGRVHIRVYESADKEEAASQGSYLSYYPPGCRLRP